jgi:hypothetical protein
MVLVAPDPVRIRPARGGVAGAAGPDVLAAAAPGSAKSVLLAQLRESTGARPRFDGVAGGLRAWLEDAAYTAVTARGLDAPPLYAGPHRLLGPPAGERVGEGPLEARVLARLVRALFRQLITVGVIGDPLSDALDALRADGGEPDEVRQVEAMGRGPRAILAHTVGAHAAHLSALVPRFDHAFLPRTDDRVAIPLAGGHIVLGGVFDLLVGASPSDEPALCALGVSVDGPPDRARWALHYLALLELLRSGAPPLRLAVLDSATGSFAVEDVREEHLRAVTAHVAEWLAGHAAGAVAGGAHG